MQARLLIVASAPEAARIRHIVPGTSWAVHSAELGCGSLQAVLRLKPATIILDARAPNHSYPEYVRTVLGIHGMDGVPLFALVRVGQAERLTLLEAGAKGCWTEEVTDREIRLRLMQVHARLYPDHCERILRLGNVELDLDRYAVRVNGSRVQLTALQFKLLRHLLQRPGEPCSNGKLLDELWGKAAGDEGLRKCFSGLKKALLDGGAVGVALSRTADGCAICAVPPAVMLRLHPPASSLSAPLGRCHKTATTDSPRSRAIITVP